MKLFMNKDIVSYIINLLQTKGADIQYGNEDNYVYTYICILILTYLTTRNLTTVFVGHLCAARPSPLNVL